MALTGVSQPSGYPGITLDEHVFGTSGGHWQICRESDGAVAAHHTTGWRWAARREDGSVFPSAAAARKVLAENPQLR